MKSGKSSADKDLYKQLRTLSGQRLWEQEVPKFNRATPEERRKNAALVRALGVAFATSGTRQHQEAVKVWLRGLLQDPCEKIRRYAMAALPKLGAGAAEETELLALLRTTPLEREKNFLKRSLEKIGGSAALQAITENASGSQPETEQKLRANLARTQSPSVLQLDSPLLEFNDLPIHLRNRHGLAAIVRAEVEASERAGGKFRVAEVREGLVTVTASAPFTLADIYALRCFGTVGFGIGTASVSAQAALLDALASVITAPAARRLMQTFTAGPIRYRLNFVAKGHQRNAVRLLANRVYALCPEILNDPRSATWEIDIHPGAHQVAVELRPKLSPDPRFTYRRNDVPAASYPPLAACLAQFAGQAPDEVVWDPFCGSGLELIERALRGGVGGIYGTDRSPEAIAIAKANFAAAPLSLIQPKFTCSDFRDWAAIEGLGPNKVSLIITNPPLGKRVPVPDMNRLISDLFSVAAVVLRPGGRLAMVNPLRQETRPRQLKLQARHAIDLGGFRCRVELYRKE